MPSAKPEMMTFTLNSLTSLQFRVPSEKTKTFIFDRMAPPFVFPLWLPNERYITTKHSGTRKTAGDSVKCTGMIINIHAFVKKKIYESGASLAKIGVFHSKSCSK
jgi:hypothetical protein